MSESYIILKKESVFFDVFPQGKAPVVPGSGISTGVAEKGPEAGKTFYYFKLNWYYLTKNQQIEITKRIAKIFKSTISEVDQQICRDGFLPVRTSQVKESYIREGYHLKMFL